MQATIELFRQDAVDPLVAAEERLVPELLGNDDQLEVGLGARRHGVHMALVDHLEVLR